MSLDWYLMAVVVFASVQVKAIRDGVCDTESWQ